MDQQQITIPELAFTILGRVTFRAEMQQMQDAAVIAALRADVQRLTPPAPVVEPSNGAVREAIPAAVEG